MSLERRLGKSFQASQARRSEDAIRSGLRCLNSGPRNRHSAQTRATRFCFVTNPEARAPHLGHGLSGDLRVAINLSVSLTFRSSSERVVSFTVNSLSVQPASGEIETPRPRRPCTGLASWPRETFRLYGSIRRVSRNSFNPRLKFTRKHRRTLFLAALADHVDQLVEVLREQVSRYAGCRGLDATINVWHLLIPHGISDYDRPHSASPFCDRIRCFGFWGHR